MCFNEHYITFVLSNRLYDCCWVLGNKLRF